MNTTTDQTLQAALAQFLTYLAGKNRSPLTLEAYERDLRQFFEYTPAQTVSALTKRHIADYLTYLLEERELSGVSAARKPN